MKKPVILEDSFIKPSPCNPGYYKPQPYYRGKIQSPDDTYRLDVHQIKIDSPWHYPTDQRAILQCGPHLNKASDTTFLVLPGFSETTAQLKSIIIAVLEQAKEAGYNNPQLIGLNTCGKATRSYLDHQDQISRLGLTDEFDDTKKLIQWLIDGGFIMGDVTLIGHSLGYLNALAALEILNNTRHHLTLVGLMPATDQPVAALKSARFLGAVCSHTPTALMRLLDTQGMHVGSEDHLDLMFEEGLVQHLPHYNRSHPDSALRFLQYTLNCRRRFAKVLKQYQGNAHIFSAEQDYLLPPKMAANEVKYLQSLGIPTEHHVSPHFNHGIPMDMTSEEFTEMNSFLSKVLA